jgi:esterase/lipase/1-acyl-sn-glycerol-3-phosphate acyltransferase
MKEANAHTANFQRKDPALTMQPDIPGLPPINPRAYALTRFILRRLERYLDVQLRVHALHDQFAFGGGIVVANHFTRLETFLIPYILHRRLSLIVRVLAAPMLFDNKTFGDYLRSVGALPTNYPNKYELIARDILHGGWWLIFPEGSIIKDRKVVERGRFYVTEDTGIQRRRPHSGAAILALMVQRYKDALRQALYQGKDLETIRETLGLSHLSSSELAAVAYHPTTIVPLNVTYYPLAPQDNALKAIATRLIPTLPQSNFGQRLLEELTVEGAMLLKGIEIDLRFGTPTMMQTDLPHRDDWRVIPWSSSPWRRYLNLIRRWRPTQRYAYLLDRWAALHGWRQRQRAWQITRSTLQALYNLTTVNMDHLLSVLLLVGLRHYQKQCFALTDVKRYLYLAVQALRHQKNVHLHNALTDPDLQYLLLTETPHPNIESFARRAIASKLLTCDKNTWVLAVDRLNESRTFGTIRLENFIQVCFNEVEPLSEVMHALHRALRTDLARHQTDFIDALFAYEQQLYEDEYAVWVTPERTPLTPLAYDIGRPVLLRGTAKSGRVGVLLIHGYSASPGEMLPLAHTLHTQGFTVYVVRLRGHGTSPHDLQQRTWQDWYASVVRGYRSLRMISDVQFAGGMSTGGALALYLAAHQESPLHGVFAVAAPIKLHQRFLRLIPLVKTVRDFVHAEPGNPQTNYRDQPLQALQQLMQFISHYQEELVHVRVPVLLLQARGDTTVRPESASYIYARLASEGKRLLWKDHKRHVIVGADYPDVHQDILTFLQQHSMATKFP